MRTWDAVPGVPEAGHVNGRGFWHPGRSGCCIKCDEGFSKQYHLNSCKGNHTSYIDSVTPMCAVGSTYAGLRVIRLEAPQLAARLRPHSASSAERNISIWEAFARGVRTSEGLFALRSGHTLQWVLAFERSQAASTD